MTPDAIIFDFDGVIADSEILGSQVLARALTAAGLPTSVEDVIAYYMGRSRAHTLEAVARRWGERTPPDLARRLEGCEEDLADLLEPIPGLEDFLALTDHLPRAIASSSASSYLRHHIARFGHAHRFGQHLYSGREHVTRGKPFPDLYLYAANQLGAEPARTLVIEDSPIGARAGIAAGARVLGLAAGSHCSPALSAALLAEGVECVFTSYAEMANHLGMS